MSDEYGGRLSALETELRESRRQIELLLEAIRADVHRLDVSINGPPRAESVRGRLHTIESDQSAARLSLQVAQESQKMAQEAQRRAFGAVEKVALFLFAGLGAAAGVARLFGVG
jgi:hypothetical protein